MDFDTVAGELYGGDLAEFVSARNAAAKAAKAEGDAELAAKIRELRKPTTAAAIVNRLAREDPAELRELAELGDELRAAHTRLAGDDLRALTRRRGELVRRIVHGLPSMSDTVSREVEATLEAVAADPGTAELAVAGRLTSVAHQDTDQWFTLAATAAPPSTGKRSPKLVEKVRTGEAQKGPPARGGGPQGARTRPRRARAPAQGGSGARQGARGRRARPGPHRTRGRAGDGPCRRPAHPLGRSRRTRRARDGGVREGEGNLRAGRRGRRRSAESRRSALIPCYRGDAPRMGLRTEVVATQPP